MFPLPEPIPVDQQPKAIIGVATDDRPILPICGIQALCAVGGLIGFSINLNLDGSASHTQPEMSPIPL